MKSILKKTAAYLVIFAMLITLVPQTALSVFAGELSGSGTYGDPYLIRTLAELETFRNSVNGGEDYNNKHVRLMNDIDMSERYGADKLSWTPIGEYNSSPKKPFNGTFEGNDYKITGLYINGGSNKALFGYIGEYGRVRNLAVSGEVIGYNGMAIVVGMNKGIIRNVSSYGSVGGSLDVGGICGYNYDLIEDCSNAASVNVDGDQVGGICGDNSGRIQKCYNTGSVTGNENVGGICGKNSHYTAAMIQKCYNTGSVTGNKNVGGICGINNTSTDNCYNLGSVTATTDCAGGISGDSDSGLSACYNYASVTSSGKKAGICARVNPRSIPQNNYYNSDAFDGSAFIYEWGDEVQKGGLSEAEFADQANLDGFDFESTWVINEKVGRPMLKDMEEPYLIRTLAELEAFRDSVNGGEGGEGGDTYEGKYIKLAADIDMSVSYGEGKASWTPIGNLDINFLGTFDGGGHRLSGLYINSDASRQGLFGYIGSGGTVKNLNVSGEVTALTQNTGLIAGYNCGTISNVRANGTVKGRYNVGLVVGSSRMSSAVSPKIEYAYADGSVSGYDGVGMIVGNNERATIISKCSSTGTFSLNKGGNNAAGGICGESIVGTIEYCYNAAEFVDNTDNNQSIRVGGICGQSSSKILYCYNIAPLSGYSVSGIAGLNAGTVANCYQYGSLNGEGGVNPIANNSYDSPVTNSFYNSDLFSGSDSYDGNALTAEEFSDSTKFTDWDFENIWAIDENAKRPVLRNYYEKAGSKTNPYMIRTLDELKAFRDAVNVGETYEGENVALGADIDISSETNWTPIGNGSNKHFKGSFDGRGYEINGLTVNSDSKADIYSGLFGYIGEGAAVKNLTVSGSVTTIATFSGGVSGMNYGTIENVVNKVKVNNTDIRGGHTAGGIAGGNQGKIINCTNEANIEGTVESVGGIAGYNTSAGESKRGSIEYCKNTGNIQTTNSAGYAGGITGKINAYATVNDVYSTGTVSGTTSGGIVGEISGLGAKLSNGYYDNVKFSGEAYGSLESFTGKEVENVGGRPTASFTSGEVAHLLQSVHGNDFVWGQDLTGTADTLPEYTGDITKKVFKLTLMQETAEGDPSEYIVDYVNYKQEVNLSEYPTPPDVNGEFFSAWATAKYVFTFDKNDEDKVIYPRMLSYLRFTVTGTNQVYKTDTAHEIEVTPHPYYGARHYLKVSYYEVDENSGKLKSTTPVAKAISSGKYFYVISLDQTNMSDDDKNEYRIEHAFKVTDTTLPNTEDYDNIGYMYITPSTEQLMPISFADGSVNLKVGEEYRNVLANPNLRANVSFSSSNPDVAAVDADGKITAKAAGNVTITAECSSETATPVYASYTITVRKELSGADFDIIVSEKVYNGDKSANAAAVIKSESLADSGDVVTASVSAEFLDENAGSDKGVSYKILGISGRNADKYVLGDDVSGFVTNGIITKAPVTVICAETTTRTYDGSAHSVDISAMANGNIFDSSNYTVKYYQDDTEIEPVNVGTYTAKLILNDDAAKNYEIKTMPTASLVIKNAAQDVFSIENVPDTVYYGDTFTVSTYGTSADANVVYSIEDGESVAEIGETSGEVIIKDIGRVTIKATSKRTGYSDKTAVKTIEVKKRILTPTAVASNRDYNGENSVDVTIALENKLSTSGVSATATGTMLNEDAGVGKTVYINNITLSGDDCEKYTLSTQSVQTTVDITPITISGFSITADSKIYDKSADAQAYINEIFGVLDKDKSRVSIIGSASFNNENAEENKTVTFTATELSGEKAANYSIPDDKKTATATASILPMPIDFTIGQTVFVYDGGNKEISVSAGDANGRLFKNYRIEYSPDIPNGVGEYTAKVKLDDENNYTTSQGDIKVEVQQASQSQLVISGVPGTVSYGDSFSLEAFGGADGGTYEWTVEGDALSVENNSQNPASVTANKTGRAKITVTKKTANFSDVSTSVILTVMPKSVAFDLSNLEQMYDGNAKAVSVSPSAGLVDGVDYKILYNGSEDKPTEVGRYSVKAETINPNYSGAATGTLIINKALASGEIVGVSDSYTYGETVENAAVSGNPNGTTAEITYSGTGIYTPQTEPPKNAGSYVAVATISGANYETLTVTKSFKIEKAVLRVSAKNVSRGYGESNPPLGINYWTEDFKYGDTKDVLLSEPVAAVNANATSAVGSYPITVSRGSAENYIFDYINTGDNAGVLTITGATGGTLTITGAPGTANVGDKFYLYAFYGNTKIDAEWQSDNPEIAEIDKTSGMVTAKKVGTAKITAKADDNYSGATAVFDLAVRQSGVVIVPTGLVKTYNGQRQDISFTSSEGFTPILSGEGKNVDVRYTLTTDPTVTEPIQAGVYSVVYTVSDESFTGGGTATMYINKANVTLNPKNITKLYGDEPSFELEASSELVGEDLLKAIAEKTIFTSDGAERTAPVKDGGYEISATVLENALSDDNLNIKLSGQKGILTVQKAPLTVKVKDVIRDYGADNPKLEAEVSGFKNDETVDVLGGELVMLYDGSINSETAIGDYNDCTTASGYTSDNYDITYISGNVKITKIKVTATAGISRSSYLTVKLDKSIAGLTADNFEVKNGDETITLTGVTASSDNLTYTLNGSFTVGTAYTVIPKITSETHEIISEALTITPSRSSSGGSGGGSSGGGGGGSVVPTTYTVSFETNGGSKVDSVKVSKNETVKEPTDPTRDNFTFEGWYSDKELTEEYDFSAKVTKNITLYAKWSKEQSQPTNPTNSSEPKWENPFTDVTENDWYFENVKYANQNGLMSGVTNSEFAPDGTLTRAMLVTVLWRAEKEPVVDFAMQFTDVVDTEYYAEAVRWAASENIVNGITETEFAPDENITREQIAAIMFRYAKHKGYDVSVGENTNILSYTDFDEISEYAINAVQYAVGSGLMKGKTETTLNPKDNATRAEIAAILQRFVETNK